MGSMSFTEYFTSAVLQTVRQMLMGLGPLLIFALLMNFIAAQLERTSIKLLGTKAYLLIFGWLGTAFHELSHAFFAVLFGHKIDDIKLFKVDKESGSLGYVKHSYNPRNPYHQLGNFFIGTGPVLMGTAAIFALLFLLIGIAPSAFPVISIDESGVTIEAIKLWAARFPEILSLIFSKTESLGRSSWWRLALLLYSLLAIGSSITLSQSDVKTAFWGFMMMLLLWLLFNLSTLWIEGFSVEVMQMISSFISLFLVLMLLALLVNLAMLGIMALLLMLKRTLLSR